MLTLIHGRNGLLPFLLHACLRSLVVTALPPVQYGDFGFAPPDSSDKQGIDIYSGEPRMTPQDQRWDNGQFGNAPSHPMEVDPANGLTFVSHPPHVSAATSDFSDLWGSSSYPFASSSQSPAASSGGTQASFVSEGTLPNVATASEQQYYPIESRHPSVYPYVNPQFLFDDVDDSLSRTYVSNQERIPVAQAYGYAEQPNPPSVFGNLNNGQGTQPEIDPAHSSQQSFPGNSYEYYNPWFSLDNTESVPTLVPGHPPAVPEAHDFQNHESLNDDSSVRPSTAGYVSSGNSLDSAPVIPSSTNSMIPGPPTASPDGQRADPSALRLNHDPQIIVPDKPDIQSTTGPQKNPQRPRNARKAWRTDPVWPTPRGDRRPTNPSNEIIQKVTAFPSNDVRRLSGLDIPTDAYLDYNFFRKMADQLPSNPSFQDFLGALYRPTPDLGDNGRHPFLYVRSAAFVNFCDSLPFGSLEPDAQGLVEKADTAVLKSQYFLQARQYADLIKNAYIRRWFIEYWKSVAQHATTDAVVLWYYLTHVATDHKSKLMAEVSAHKSTQDLSVWTTHLREELARLEFLGTEEKSYHEYLVNELCLYEGSASGKPLENSLEIKIREYAESLRHVDGQAAKILDLLDPSCSEKTIVDAAITSMNRRYGDMNTRSPAYLEGLLRQKNPHLVFAGIPFPATVLLGYRQEFSNDLGTLEKIRSQFQALVSMPSFSGIELPLKAIPFATHDYAVSDPVKMFEVNPAFKELFGPFSRVRNIVPPTNPKLNIPSPHIFPW
ncbi:hypothetical protein CXG81DRAFT_19809 [Caulochytrium protostelioides]|uniref:Uncharacterized protein n=1 Tax=Caulochytrium protostelioides TaxID=1555241 RepID=A0A4P9X587_9FUNG|nr:hypothetical protein CAUPRSCDRAFT_11766 [Caulochytrium protostelioides]RKP00221.1 hypothetical protein CXG81DRAFT_19809 [Caulochytrium protostelioides]|eukprot:RKP00221.1 hypothetical protein CXG81DRAFT_19809 [Caulochytrium protostelioides]